MKKIITPLWIICTILAFALLLYSLSGFAFAALNDTDYPYGLDLTNGFSMVSFTGAGSKSFYSPVSSASYYVYRWKEAGTPRDVWCGNTKWSSAVADTGWIYRQCDGYSLKGTNNSGTAVKYYTYWIGDAYIAPSAGTMTVDMTDTNDTLLDLGKAIGGILLVYLLIQSISQGHHIMTHK